jgi:predicted component of type VI protein secretion system
MLEEIQERHGHPDAASYYRAVAQWPEFLETAWERISPLVGTAPYEERKRDVLGAARSSVLELPLPSKSDAAERSVNDEQIEEIRAVLAVFRFRLVSDMLLDVSLIKALIDGPEATRFFRFSFATR